MNAASPLEDVNLMLMSGKQSLLVRTHVYSQTFLARCACNEIVRYPRPRLGVN